MILALGTIFASGVMLRLADGAARTIVLSCLAALVLAVLKVRQITVHLAVWTGVTGRFNFHVGYTADPGMPRLGPTGVRPPQAGGAANPDG